LCLKLFKNDVISMSCMPTIILIMFLSQSSVNLGDKVSYVVVTLLTFIQEVPALNLKSDITIIVDFSLFPSVPVGEYSGSTS
jgi:hypothetical protein